jgi:ketosteroid isomerase-like protein
MIGALILKLGAGRGWDALNRGDLDYFERFLAEDVVFEQPGPPPIGGRVVGKAAWRAMMQAWIDAVTSYHYRVLRIALDRPWALGLSNTVVTEFELTATRADGTTRVSRGVDVSEMRRGKLVSERTYMFDPAGEEAFLSATPAPGGEAGTTTG